MDYARIENGIVREIVTVPPDLAVTVAAPDGTLTQRPAGIGDLFAPELTFVQAGDGVTVGMTWSEVDGFAAPPLPAPVVPAAVEMRQFRIALHRAGLLGAVATAAAEADAETEIEWSFATVVTRSGPLPPLTGLDDAALDALFTAAAAI